MTGTKAASLWLRGIRTGDHPLPHDARFPGNKAVSDVLGRRTAFS